MHRCHCYNYKAVYTYLIEKFHKPLKEKQKFPCYFYYIYFSIWSAYNIYELLRVGGRPLFWISPD